MWCDQAVRRDRYGFFDRRGLPPFSPFLRDDLALRVEVFSPRQAGQKKTRLTW
jgi:hypothetical protein